MTSVDSINIATSVNAEHPGLQALANAVAEICMLVPVAAGTAGLADALARIAPNFRFREVLCRGGWYRPGGVIDAAGSHVADDLVLAFALFGGGQAVDAHVDHRRAGLDPVDRKGMVFNPLAWSWSLSDRDLSVNYVTASIRR